MKVIDFPSNNKEEEPEEEFGETSYDITPPSRIDDQVWRCNVAAKGGNFFVVAWFKKTKSSIPQQIKIIAEMTSGKVVDASEKSWEPMVSYKVKVRWYHSLVFLGKKNYLKYKIEKLRSHTLKDMNDYLKDRKMLDDVLKKTQS